MNKTCGICGNLGISLWLSVDSEGGDRWVCSTCIEEDLDTKPIKVVANGRPDPTL